MPIPGYDTGGGGGGSTGTYDARLPKTTSGLSAAASTFQSMAKSLQDTINSDVWECQSGYELVKDSGGGLVCRSRTTGNVMAPRMKGSAGGSSGTPKGITAASTTSAPSGSTTTGGKYLEAGADIFARNPQAMLADILEQIHPNDNGAMGIYHMLAPYGDAANVIFLGQRGQDAGGGTKPEFLDWLENDYWNALQTPGASIDVNSVIQNALNPAANSPLAAYLAVGTPEQQARNFQNLLAGAYQVGYHPLIADAMNYRLNYAANEFLGEAARGETDPFYQWIAASMPAGWAPGSGRAY